MKRLSKVTLTDEERQQLQEMVGKGKSNAQKIKHANILLACDESESVKRSDVEVAQLFHCHAKTVYNIRERFVEQGLEAALERKKRETPPRPPIFDGRAEARLIAVAPSSTTISSESDGPTISAKRVRYFHCTKSRSRRYGNMC